MTENKFTLYQLPFEQKTFLNQVLFIFKVGLDFMKVRKIIFYKKPCISIFGSARFNENHEYYKQAFDIASEAGKLGYSIITGGGPGLMEAANKGAKSSNAISIGCNIILPNEQCINKYLDISANTKYFFLRKLALFNNNATAYIFLPGGFGTLDELFEALTLIQTKKNKKSLIIIVNTNYYKNLIEHIEIMKKENAISVNDLDYIFYINDKSELNNILVKFKN